MKNKQSSRNRNTLFIPLLIVGILFFVIGFGVGISGFLTPFLKDALNLSVTESYLVLPYQIEKGDSLFCYMANY